MNPRLSPSRPARLFRRCSPTCRAIYGGLVSSASPASSFSSASSAPRPRHAASSESPCAVRMAAGLHTTAAVRLAAPVVAGAPSLPADYVPPTQPPSAKKAEFRKTQLLRSYTSMLRTSPLMLIFQHGNLTGPEWTAVRRELSLALDKVDEQQKLQGIAWPDNFASSIRMQVIRTRVFDVALRLVEFYDPAAVQPAAPGQKVYNHDLSKAAYTAIKAAAAAGLTSADKSSYGNLSPLFVGPMAVLTFPAVTPAHLSAALSVLAPIPPAFPAPSRKKNPSYYDPVVQNSLPKLLLVGGRVEGKAFDTDGVKWVGSISGGRAGLQAQLVAMLQSAGLGLTTVLEGASKSLWLTMESRRTVLEEGEKKPE